MKNFAHVNATSPASAVKLLSLEGQSKPIAGGTDIVSELKLGIIETERLVNLKTISDLNYVRFDSRQGLRIGALATLGSIAGNEIVQQKYPVLFQAISQTASPQLRNMVTIGGNLCQDSRCWYYRGDFNCWLKGGEKCYARDGENTYHAIFSRGPCYSVHPSDPAPALIALGARVSILDNQGERKIPLDQLFRIPQDGARKLTALNPQELITEVQLPAPDSSSRGKFLKAMERRVWAFALVSVAVQIDFEDNKVTSARVVLGGVANTPWRLTAVEEYLQGQSLDEVTINRIGELAVDGSRPLQHNSYKIPLVKGLLKQAFSTL